MINPKIAGILGMDIPDDTVGGEIIMIEPHEIVVIDNPNLPPMEDINRKHLQAEKELQEVIDASLGYQRDLFVDIASVEPKYRSRYIEVVNGTLALALDAIKTKIRAQEEQKKLRLAEASFVGVKEPGVGVTNNTFFNGSREELIAIMRDSTSKTEIHSK